VVAPVEPAVALDVILARHQAAVSRQQANLASTRAAVESWLSTRPTTGDGSFVERISTLEGVRHRITEIAAECREEFWSLNPDGAQTPDNIAASRAPNLALLDRGITMKSVFNDSAANDAATAEHLRWLAENGADVRTTPMLTMRMLVVDREVAMVPIDDQDSSTGAFLIRGRGLVSGLTTLFLTTWRSATPLGVRRPRQPDRPSPTERQALVLWGLGCTDAMVARRLGVSERTVRRLSENLAQRLQARSRFEMGVKAAELRWITSDDLHD
jgi:DNA-binding CsgD family transcriptional regulator